MSSVIFHAVRYQINAGSTFGKLHVMNKNWNGAYYKNKKKTREGEKVKNSITQSNNTLFYISCV